MYINNPIIKNIYIQQRQIIIQLVWYTVYATSDDIDELKKQLENLEKKIKKINKLIRDHKNEGHVVARY